MREGAPAGDEKGRRRRGASPSGGFCVLRAGGRRKRSKGVGKRDEVQGYGKGGRAAFYKPRLWKAQEGLHRADQLCMTAFLIGCFYLHRNNFPTRRSAAGNGKGKCRRGHLKPTGFALRGAGDRRRLLAFIGNLCVKDWWAGRSAGLRGKADEPRFSAKTLESAEGLHLHPTGFALCGANTLLGAPPPQTPMKKRLSARFAFARNEA